MTNPNPDQAPDSDVQHTNLDAPPPTSPQKAAYNVVTDVVTGANVRWKDNLFQAVAILVCLVLGIAIGFYVSTDRALGVIAGGFIGLLCGLFGSGIFLMIYRGLQHLRGKHD